MQMLGECEKNLKANGFVKANNRCEVGEEVVGSRCVAFIAKKKRLKKHAPLTTLTNYSAYQFSLRMMPLYHFGFMSFLHSIIISCTLFFKKKGKKGKTLKFRDSLQNTGPII